MRIICINDSFSRTQNYGLNHFVMCEVRVFYSLGKEKFFEISLFFIKFYAIFERIKLNFNIKAVTFIKQNINQPQSKRSCTKFYV